MAKSPTPKPDAKEEANAKIRLVYEQRVSAYVDKVLTNLDRVNKQMMKRNAVQSGDAEKVVDAVRQKLDTIASTSKATLSGQKPVESNFSL